MLDSDEKVYPLAISPERFNSAYNIDISPYIVRHTFKESAQKTNKEINYLSYSHAYRLFRTHFPELEVGMEVNTATGGYVFREVADRGFFIKSYVYTRDADGLLRRSASYYYPILTVSGLAVYPNDPVIKKDFKSGEFKAIDGQYVADIQLINKSVQRSIVKAIALTTGIGLKLWTGDDVGEEVVDRKFQALSLLQSLAQELGQLSGTYTEPSSTYADSMDVITAEGKRFRSWIAEYKVQPPAVTSTSPADNQTTQTQNLTK